MGQFFQNIFKIFFQDTDDGVGKNPLFTSHWSFLAKYGRFTSHIVKLFQ